MNDNLHQLRCFGCGARIAGADAQPDFRCVLSAVTCLKWSTPAGASAGPRPAQPRGAEVAVAGAALLAEGLDHSGVWRFRELLPILEQLWQRGDPARGQHAALSADARFERLWASTSFTPSIRG
jgi:hypothetical protein